MVLWSEYLQKLNILKAKYNSVGNVSCDRLPLISMGTCINFPHSNFGFFCQDVTEPNRRAAGDVSEASAPQRKQTADLATHIRWWRTVIWCIGSSPIIFTLIASNPSRRLTHESSFSVLWTNWNYFNPLHKLLTQHFPSKFDSRFLPSNLVDNHVGCMQSVDAVTTSNVGRKMHDRVRSLFHSPKLSFIHT